MLRNVSSSAASLAHIAAAAGVSRMTVSRALRGVPGVRQALRAKILRLAERSGYTPDPSLGRLMGALRRARADRYRETVAFVQTHASYAAEEEFLGAEAQGERLGYKVERFRPWAEGLDGRGLSRVLQARGIRGVLLAPNVGGRHPRYWLDWPRFATVLLGSSLVNKGLPRVQFDHYGSTFTALRKLQHAGHRRIGLVIGQSLRERAWHRHEAAYQAYADLPGAERDRLTFFVEAEDDRSAFRRWLKRVRPEALLLDTDTRSDWLREEGGGPALPLPVAAAAVGKYAGAIAGVFCAVDQIGVEAMNVLSAQLVSKQFGLRPLPHTVFLPGEWRDGRSLSRRRS